ncbi:MAG: hypothetical protein Q8O25_09800 [Sulfurisoma sp.]|nr:hypothetical protein [Sulfurisoma sp.]
MMTAEQNFRLLEEIDANRRFLLQAYRSNPALLARLDERIRQALVAAFSSPTPASEPHRGGAAP